MTYPLIQTQEELDRVRVECYSMVTKRATVSAGSSVIPVVGVDVAADVALLLQLIPAINKEFGLSTEQIQGYDKDTKILLHGVIKNTGIALIGQELTKTLVTSVLKKVAGRTFAKQFLKFVPVIGWAVNAGIGFAAMKYVGNSHVDDCYRVCRRLMEFKEVANRTVTA